MEVPSLEDFLQLKEQVARLTKLVEQSTNYTPAMEWVRADVAESLLNVSRTTLWRLTKDGKIVTKKRGRVISFKLESIREYLVSQNIKPEIIGARINSLLAA